MLKDANVKKPAGSTAVLVLADGSVFWGRGFGTPGQTTGEICFNTAMTGYQEVLTDPSYAGQIITFTFPHIGNTGINNEDNESAKPAARGLIVRGKPTAPSSHRATEDLDGWLLDHGIPGIYGLDTRALTRRIRDHGAPNGVLCHDPEGNFDLPALQEQAQKWPGLNGMDLAKTVTCEKKYDYAALSGPHVVAIDYGIKENILRCLAAAGCRVTVVPCTTPANDILALEPDGVFLSNGPGDPAATGAYAVPVIRDLLKTNKPLFGICLGHQLLALALGGTTQKMALGHRGANHPVKNLETGHVEITSQNHGFCVLPESLPDTVEITHTSLFDHSNEGLRLKGRPVFSVQYHPEASPGPHDSHYLFKDFVEMMR